jgi:hypothetical protein
VPLQHTSGVANPSRQRGRIVDADVPVATFQRFEVAVAVAEQLLDGTGPSLLLTTAVEDRDVMSPGQRLADLVRADETGATQDQQAHGFRGLGVRKGRQGHGQGRKRGASDKIAAIHIVLRIQESAC